MIIAIDGPAGAGKSTVAKLLAKKLKFLYLDTGAMYRALTLKVLLDGSDVSSAIRQPVITQFVSDIAKIGDVRKIMVELQRKLGGQGDAVLDGRDIGTVVFPDAHRKFYVDADFKERVNRRYKEALGLGQNVTFEGVAEDLSNRDTIDSNRKVAPLKQAEDAIYVDTTNLSIEEVVDKLLKEI